MYGIQPFVTLQANADEKQVRKTKMEILMKELDGLLKQDGNSSALPFVKCGF